MFCWDLGFEEGFVMDEFSQKEGRYISINSHTRPIILLSLKSFRCKSVRKQSFRDFEKLSLYIRIRYPHNGLSDVLQARWDKDPSL